MRLMSPTQIQSECKEIPHLAWSWVSGQAQCAPIGPILMYLMSNVLWMPSVSAIGGIFPRIHVSTSISSLRVGPTSPFQKSLFHSRFLAITLNDMPAFDFRSITLESPGTLVSFNGCVKT